MNRLYFTKITLPDLAFLVLISLVDTSLNRYTWRKHNPKTVLHNACLCCYQMYCTTSSFTRRPLHNTANLCKNCANKRRIKCANFIQKLGEVRRRYLRQLTTGCSLDMVFISLKGFFSLFWTAGRFSDPDPGFKFLWIRIRFQFPDLDPGRKSKQKPKTSFTKNMTKDRQRI